MIKNSGRWAPANLLSLAMSSTTGVELSTEIRELQSLSFLFSNNYTHSPFQVNDQYGSKRQTAHLEATPSPSSPPPSTPSGTRRYLPFTDVARRRCAMSAQCGTASAAATTTTTEGLPPVVAFSRHHAGRPREPTSHLLDRQEVGVQAE